VLFIGEPLLDMVLAGFVSREACPGGSSMGIGLYCGLTTITITTTTVCLLPPCTSPALSPLFVSPLLQDPTWRKLCFCGFREDLAHLPQAERDRKPGMWPGACPPRLCRIRKVGDTRFAHQQQQQ
jgi:hypothetical protein